MARDDDPAHAEAVRKLKEAGGQMVVGGYLFVLDDRGRIMKTRAPVVVDPESGRIRITKP